VTTSIAIAPTIPVPTAATVPASVAIAAVAALSKRRPVPDGGAGSMAEIQLNAERKGRSNACYCGEDI
jgi:hypothetical protein